jgi:hypothetical protein
MTKVHHISSLPTDPQARQAKEDLGFSRYSMASRPSFLGYMPGYDPDYDKYVDVFEPDEGMFLIREKDIVEQPKDYFFEIRRKMDKHYDKKFQIEPLVDKGILVLWKSDPEYDYTY